MSPTVSVFPSPAGGFHSHPHNENVGKNNIQCFLPHPPIISVFLGFNLSRIGPEIKHLSLESDDVGLNPGPNTSLAW